MGGGEDAVEARRASLIATALVAALLAGCNEDVSRLKSENARLRQELAQQAGQRQADLDYMEKQAGIAAGCDWLLPLCPGSIVETGRQAQEQGFSGSHSFHFWLAFILKLLAAGSFLGGMGGIAAWLWVQIGRPDAEAVARAERLIEQGDAIARAAQQRAAQAEARAQELDRANDEAQAALDDLNQQIEAGKRALEAQKREIEATKAAQAALSAFD